MSIMVNSYVPGSAGAGLILVAEDRVRTGLLVNRENKIVVFTKDGTRINRVLRSIIKAIVDHVLSRWGYEFHKKMTYELDISEHVNNSHCETFEGSQEMFSAVNDYIADNPNIQRVFQEALLRGTSVMRVNFGSIFKQILSDPEIEGQVVKEFERRSPHTDRIYIDAQHTEVAATGVQTTPEGMREALNLHGTARTAVLGVMAQTVDAIGTEIVHQVVSGLNFSYRARNDLPSRIQIGKDVNYAPDEHVGIVKNPFEIVSTLNGGAQSAALATNIVHRVLSDGSDSSSILTVELATRD